jgi:hypothetical protein
MTTTVKGRFTFRFAAACFGVSAAFELLNLRDEAVLFGHILAGAPAAIYHIAYAALFAWLMVGLWNASRSGYYTLVATSIIYTVDRLQLLFAGDTLAAMLRQQAAQHPEMLQIISVEDLLGVLTVTVLAILLCWWGFVGYAYYRRDYFGIRSAPHSKA